MEFHQLKPGVECQDREILEALGPGAFVLSENSPVVAAVRNGFPLGTFNVGRVQNNCPQMQNYRLWMAASVLALVTFHDDGNGAATIVDVQPLTNGPVGDDYIITCALFDQLTEMEVITIYTGPEQNEILGYDRGTVGQIARYKGFYCTAIRGMVPKGLPITPGETTIDQLDRQMVEKISWTIVEKGFPEP